MCETGSAFYSCGVGNPHQVEGHDTREEALQAAGVEGLIWISGLGTVRQVYQNADGHPITLSPDYFASVQFIQSLQAKGLIPTG